MTPRSHPSPPSAQVALLWVVALVPSLLAVAAVASVAGNARASTSSRTAADAPCPDAAAHETTIGTSMEAVPVGTAREPTWFAGHPRRAGVGVLTERAGRVLAVEDGRPTSEVLLDLTADTATKGDGGLLTAAYDHDGRWLYLLRTLRSGDDVLTAHALWPDGRPVDRPGRVVLVIPHGPSLQHHGGTLVALPDGTLVVGTGDGGGLGDPRENAQDPASLLGKLLRIRPTPDAERPYGIPSDNPFTERHGWRPEIFALGLRNPYRASVDAEHDRLWVGDVGQSCWEELDRLPMAGGANLQWDRREGPATFEGGELLHGRSTGPVLSIAHADGWCAIVTGYVLRDAGRSLDGRLLLSDYCAARIVSVDVDHPDAPPQRHHLGVELSSVTAIVPGPSGRPWVLSLDGAVWELTPRDG